MPKIYIKFKIIKNIDEKHLHFTLFPSFFKLSIRD